MSTGPGVADTAPVSWTVENVVYEIDLLAIDGLEWRDAKRAVGRPLTEGQLAVWAIDGDLECVAALVWLARRRAEPDVDYEDVLASMRLQSFVPQQENGEATDG